MKLHRGKETGVINDFGIYVSKRLPQHYFKKFKGLGLSCCIVENLIADKTKTVVFLFKKEWGQDFKKLKAAPIDFKRHGIKYYFKQGGEYQYILPLKYFKGWE